MVSEAIALFLNWILIVAFVLDFTNIKVLVGGEGFVSTFTVIWWMKWEVARLPKPTPEG